MTLPELSIKRHVLAYMMSAVLVLFGLVAYDRLGVDRFPNIDFPIISITTVMPGANPEIVDSSITNIIETAVNSTPGIDHIQSVSSPGVSVVAITFNLNKDVDVAFNEVQAKVNQVLRQLPNDADPPIVAKLEMSATPIMWLALQGDRTQQQLNQYARTVIKKKLETVDGVGEVRLGGKRDRTIRVNLDLPRMAAYQITAQDLLAAFKSEHLQLPGGFLVNQRSEDMIKLDLEFHNLADLEQMLVAWRNGAPVRLRDIAQLEDGLEDFRQIARFNGQPAIGLGIIKVANTNTVAIIDEVKRRLETDILPQLPPGMTLRIASDQSNFILEMVLALQEHLLLGTLLAALVVFVFLKNLRSTLIVAVAIPVSLFGAIAVMYFAGFTFNTMTLLALLLLVGVVVDDAIVVLENIYRHREHLESDPKAAALNGTNQVVFAVLAATLSLVSIFAPVIFLGGIIGRFFQSFAVVVTFGVLVSWFVSMTLTPMLCSRYLAVDKKHGKLYNTFERMFEAMEAGYRKVLGMSLNHRWLVLLITVAIVLSSGFFFSRVGKGFVPEEDEGRFMVVVKTPLGSNIDYTLSRLDEVEKVLAHHNQIEGYFTAVGLGQAGQVTQGMAFVNLKPRDQRSKHQNVIIEEVRRGLFQIPGAQAFAMQVPIVGGQRGEPLQFAITGPNLQETAHLAEVLRQKLGNIPELGRVDLDLQLNLPQLEPHIDRLRAADLGLSTSDIATAVFLLASGADVAKYNDVPGDGERYDIRIKGREDHLTDLEDLKRIYLRNRQGAMVRLDSVMKFERSLGPATISRLDLQYSAMFYTSPSIPLGAAVNRVRDEAAQVLPLGYQVKFLGQAEEFGKTVGYMLLAFAMAIILLYMVLASQFNSFLQPLIIMIAQPLAMIGGVAGLWLFSHSLNIYSMIGLVLLLGLVAKNSILLVDLTNQLRAEGREINVALLEACPIRLRPVLMTSLTVILALLPAAIGLGAGADTNGPLAVAVIGGMITSTLLTLVVIPAVYSLAENGVQRLRRRRQAV